MYIVKAIVNGFPKAQALYYSDLARALDQACAFIDGGCANVSIDDDRGRSISGSELIACCRGERRLNSDLSSSSN